MKSRHFRHALSVQIVFGATVYMLVYGFSVCFCEGVCEQVMWPWPEGHWKPSVPFSSPDIPSILTATSPAVNSEKQRAGSLAALLGTLLKLPLPNCQTARMQDQLYKPERNASRTIKLVTDQQWNQISRRFHTPQTRAVQRIASSTTLTSPGHWQLGNPGKTEHIPKLLITINF